MDEICVAKFGVYECRKSDRASALSGAQLIICAAQTPEFPDTIPTILNESVLSAALNLALFSYLTPHVDITLNQLRTSLDRGHLFHYHLI